MTSLEKKTGVELISRLLAEVFSANIVCHFHRFESAGLETPGVLDLLLDSFLNSKRKEYCGSHAYDGRGHDRHRPLSSGLFVILAGPVLECVAGLPRAVALQAGGLRLLLAGRRGHGVGLAALARLSTAVV